MPKRVVQLTDLAVRSAKRAEKAYKLSDGGGMYLEVMPTGSKFWRLKYRQSNGKENRLTFGVYPEVTLSVQRYRRIATEGALLGSLQGLHIAENLAIISDDAGQFNVLTHGLCWVHAERLVHKMLPLNDQHRIDIARVRGQIWDLYADLKSYKAQRANSRTALRSASMRSSLRRRATLH